MSTVTLGLKVDETLRTRIREAAVQQGRTPHWLIKQAVLQYVEGLERGLLPASSVPGDHLHHAADADDADEPSAPAVPSAQPFLDWAQSVLPQTDLRAAITAAWHRPEAQCLPMLVQLAHTADAAQRAAIEEVATELVEGLRGKRDAGGV